MIDNKQLIEEFTGRFEAGYDSKDFFIKKQETDFEQIELLYTSLPKRFPKTFEYLVQNYRWCNAMVGNLNILDNPGENELTGFLEEILADKHLAKVCLSNNFIQIGKLADSYDPVCFNCNEGVSRRNYDVVVLDHERILNNSLVKVTDILARNFDDLLRSNENSV